MRETFRVREVLEPESDWNAIDACSAKDAAEIFAARLWGLRSPDYPSSFELEVMGDASPSATATGWHVDVETVPHFVAGRVNATKVRRRGGAR